jgi:hypothetical protein
LKLSEQGREKIGRPPNTLDETETKAVQEKKPALLPTMFSLTEMIDSLGMLNKHWASGETLASFQPIS